jgi:Bacterial SH3 domain
MNFRRIAAVAAASLALSASYARALPALAAGDVKVRQGPGTNYRIVGTIPGGSTVEVSGCRGRWCMIVWRGGSGYATAASFIPGGAPPRGVYVAPPVDDYPGFEFGPDSAHYYGPYSGYGHYWPNRWWW